jgi:hypothetical protein
MAIWRTARTSLAVGASAYAQGDALGTKISFSGIPEQGIIRAMTIVKLMLTIEY